MLDFNHTFRALGNRNYRLFFIGQAISLIGTWMQQVAISWFVYTWTGSKALLGTLTFVTLFPTFLVAPFAGVLIDRWNKHRVIVITQILSMAQATVLSVLVISGQQQIWHLLVLSLLIGLVSAVDMPCRQSFMVEIVNDRSDLPNAIALNSSMFNFARLIGPVIAAQAMYFFGAGTCFSANAISYLAVIGGLLMMRLPVFVPRVDKRHVASEFMEGLRYAWNSAPLRILLSFLWVISLSNGAFAVLMPALAKDHYQGSVRIYGALFFFIGIGALVAAIGLASYKKVSSLAKVMLLSAVLYCGCLVLVTLSIPFWMALPILLGLGMGSMGHMACTNTLIQTVVEDRYRGRVMAFYSSAFVGSMPIGGFISGQVSSALGIQWTLIGFGVLGLVGCAVFYTAYPRFKTAMQPFFVAKGIVETA